jgi:hypothetical protein
MHKMISNKAAQLAKRTARKPLEETLIETRNHLLAILPYHHGEVQQQVEDRFAQVKSWLFTVQRGRIDLGGDRAESMFESCEEWFLWK